MKIGIKIILGFVAVSLIMGFGWYFSIYTNNLIVDSFEHGEQHFGSVIEASNEVSSYAKRAEGHAMLYLTLNNGSDKKKFHQRIDSLREQISLIENNVSNQEAINISSLMRAETDELQSTGELLFQEHDNELNSSGKFEYGNHEKSIRRLDDIAANIRRYGLDMGKLEIGFQQEMNDQAKKRADNIQKIILIIGIIAVIGSLSFGYGISRNIVDPIMKFKTAANKIGMGNLSSRLDITSKDEIGELALTFNRMISYLQNQDKERRNNEDELRQAFKNWDDTFNAISDGVWILDIEGHILQSNGIYERSLGMAKEDVLNQHHGKIAHQIYDLVEYPPFNMMMKTGKRGVKILEDKERGKWLHITVDPIFDVSGKITRAVHVVKDITEERKSEEMRIQKERVEYANRTKSEFLATMSHELRTPLNSIIGFTELMKEKVWGELNEKQSHYMDNVLSSSRFLLDLINDILDLSKVEAGKIEIVKEKMSVPGTIGETLILIKEKASKHNVEINQVFDPQLDVIVADKQRFKQILFNLLSNAIKFIKKEGGAVTITTKKEEDMAKISVSDTGIGIKEEDMGKLFHEFSQVNSKISNQYGGTGLGLMITKRFVELHGGSIEVVSKYGEGSTFTFTLPLLSKEQEKKMEGDGEL
jgi:PAS domain S-box-containing protein